MQINEIFVMPADECVSQIETEAASAITAAKFAAAVEKNLWAEFITVARSVSKAEVGSPVWEKQMDWKELSLSHALAAYREVVRSYHLARVIRKHSGMDQKLHDRMQRITTSDEMRWARMTMIHQICHVSGVREDQFLCNAVDHVFR